MEHHLVRKILPPKKSVGDAAARRAKKKRPTGVDCGRRQTLTDEGEGHETRQASRGGEGGVDSYTLALLHHGEHAHTTSLMGRPLKAD